MSRRLKIACDKCKKQFNLTSTFAFEENIQHKTLGLLKVAGFRCPFCKHKYIVTATDKTLETDIKAYQFMLKTSKDGKTIGDLRVKIEQSMQKIEDVLRVEGF